MLVVGSRLLCVVWRVLMRFVCCVWSCLFVVCWLFVVFWCVLLFGDYRLLFEVFFDGVLFVAVGCYLMCGMCCLWCAIFFVACSDCLRVVGCCCVSVCGVCC